MAGILLQLTGQALSGEGVVIGFEDLELSEPPLKGYAGPGGGAYYDGSDVAGGFTSEGIHFWNDYNVAWGSWIGWVYSTTNDTETAGFGNQYSSFAGGAGEGEVYAVTYAPSFLKLPAGYRAPLSLLVSNTTYAGLSMKEGDAFARKFGVGDSFLLRMEGWTESGAPLGAVEVYLADFRGPEGEGTILEDWLEVDLSPLTGWAEGGVAEIRFSLESTDRGAFGMNTPSYLAIDRLVLGLTPTWGPYDRSLGNVVETGPFLGKVYPQGDFAYLYDLEKWVYLPESQLEGGTGAWMYVPNGNR